MTAPVSPPVTIASSSPIQKLETVPPCATMYLTAIIPPTAIPPLMERSGPDTRSGNIMPQAMIPRSAALIRMLEKLLMV